ncbi:MAG TPA: hypothetical protein VFM54_12315 [Micromonosporaceae bacterium]|nr:hypothetical protein [Micromonosporaceae bacterium]
MTSRNRAEATREKSRVALVTCAGLPTGDPDDQLLSEPLRRLGATAEPVAWDDPGVDWSAFDLAVLRSTWDYPQRLAEFLAWTATVPRLANPADVVAWNTDKHYLADLAAAGVPVVPTSWLAPGDPVALPDAGEHVLKPTVGVGSKGSGRYDLADPAHRRLASGHVARLHAAGQHVMLQPFLPAVETVGETALVFLGGAYCHAIRKDGLLTGPHEPFEGLYLPETVAARTPSPAERDAAQRALAAVPGGAGRLLYARADLLPGPHGEPLVVELELTEPSLFLGYAPGAADRLAAEIVRGAGRPEVAR